MRHPEICTARGTKETEYFDRYHDRGEDWYRDFFRHCSQAGAVGEISTGYFYNPLSAGRIRDLVPEVRLFSVLRNPFDRMRSVYTYFRRTGQVSPELPLVDAVRSVPSLPSQNDYRDRLEPYLELFPPEQICILFYEDLAADPVPFVRELLRFLGVEPDFPEELVSEKHNVSSLPRMRLLGQGASLLARALRHAGLHGILDRAKRSSLIRTLLFRPVKAARNGDSARWTPELVARLRDRWEPHLMWVEERTGRDLSAWRSPSSAEWSRRGPETTNPGGGDSDRPEETTELP